MRQALTPSLCSLCWAQYRPEIKEKQRHSFATSIKLVPALNSTSGGVWWNFVYSTSWMSEHWATWVLFLSVLIWSFALDQRWPDGEETSTHPDLTRHSWTFWMSLSGIDRSGSFSWDTQRSDTKTSVTQESSTCERKYKKSGRSPSQICSNWLHCCPGWKTSSSSSSSETQNTWYSFHKLLFFLHSQS